MTWTKIQSVLSDKSHKELLSVIRGMYRLNAENRALLDQQLLSAPIDISEYLATISHFVAPDIGQPIQLAKARTAISRYYKLTGSIPGRLQLLVHFFEEGCSFTVSYGNIHEQYYDSLTSIFDWCLRDLDKIPPAQSVPLLERLRTAVESVHMVGYGFYDYLSDRLAQLPN